MKRIILINCLFLSALSLSGQTVASAESESRNQKDKIVDESSYKAETESQYDSTMESSSSESHEESTQESVEPTSQSSDMTSETEETREVITNENNHQKGEFAFKDPSSRSKRSVAPDDVFADNMNLPGKTFIDVSSHNGNISVAEFQTIRSYGVIAVAVKLSEGTGYINDYAMGQIANAKAAGLQVFAYHFSRYRSEAEARAEATYFVNAAKSFGLPSNTIMINDAEAPDLTDFGRNAHNNSLVFNRRLKELGYSNDALYVGKWWITNGYINTNEFEKSRVWVAQYPYTPTADMTWNNDHGAWQWSSQMYFPKLANYQQRPFDMSVAYSSFYGSTGIDYSQYFTENPAKVILRGNDFYYSDTDFKNKVGSVSSNTPIDVLAIEYSSSGVPRLKTVNGYITANKKYAVKVSSELHNYFTENPTKIILRGDDFYYSDVNFNNRLTKESRNKVIDVVGIEYSDSGIPRLKTVNGYLTANKRYVTRVADNINDYFVTASKRVVLKGNDFYFADVDFTKRNETANANEQIEVSGIEYSTNGIPRFKTTKGYITANKKYAIQIVDNFSDYFSENPSKVVLRGDDFYYQDADFTTKLGKMKKQTMIDVNGIEYSSNGYPRLKLEKGLITANKKYVIKVADNINEYFTENVKKVKLNGNDYFYNDVNFKEKAGSLSKNQVIDVIGIEYSDTGISRLKTSHGYITAKKIYVTLVA
ncbi:hypothetical protein A5866_003066 [Enterococcus sp. 12C11_DIV0727]|uniref:DUF5776 domain-containing protein n=2 Tax=Candidatus Enterococcus lemimoniae TaxID=1834167 RepID=A0ABZ2T994_9ENTE